MTFEEMQRMMEFLLAQQARFDARFEKDREETRQKMAEAEAKLRESDERMSKSDELLRESQATLTAATLRIAELVEDLTLAGKRTDDRLNALIAVVEKHISSPGHSSQPR